MSKRLPALLRRVAEICAALTVSMSMGLATGYVLGSLLLLACSGETAQRPTAIVGETAQPRMAMAAVSFVADTLACLVTTPSGQSMCLRIQGRTDTLRDTIRVPVAPILVPRGVPFLATNLFRQWANRPEWGPAPFTASMNSDGPTVIVARINAARAMKHQLVITMTGGGKKNYTVTGADSGKFDLDKWKKRQSVFDTFPGVKAAILAGIADGTIIGANMLDEPQHSGWLNSISKATLDEMCVYLKGIFPTLPCGVSVKMSWRPTELFTKVDFIATQWVAPWGAVDVWRDKELAAAKLNGVAVLFSFNGLNGGAGFTETVCPFGFGDPGSKPGTFRCQMSPAQIREVALALAPYGCGLNDWEFRPELVASPEKVSALKDVAAVLAGLPAKPCRRST